MNLSNYVCDDQMTIDSWLNGEKGEYKIKHKIRLIELFAGIGSQAMGLRDIGADFERWKVVEFDKYAVNAYNAIHCTHFPVLDVTKITGADLEIRDTDKYEYILFYSFPCTDLSLAGAMRGMAEGSGTRSSLLWEVKRLIEECAELPQILIMENVPQVHSQGNMQHFQRWLDFLESKGYKTFWKDMNAKDYGIPQSRSRTIAVSLLNTHKEFCFPNHIPLTTCMADFLEDEVDERFYLKGDKAKALIDKLVADGKINVDRQTDRDNLLTFQQTIPSQSRSQTVFQPGQTEESAHGKVKAPALLSSCGTKMEKFTNMAATLMARDYKGMGKQTTNGVVEWNRIE